ncbi:hypothetical protein GQ457_05G018800 [Hibiscus cannabinus]
MNDSNDMKGRNDIQRNKRFLNFRVVYRSWTFGFDSSIPRVTISGRFCDWTGSRGLHLLVSEPGYAIIGTVSEVSLFCDMVRPRRSVRGGGQAPVHLDEVEVEQGNEETLPSPPPVGGEANEDEVTWEILLVGLSQEVIGYEM